MTPSPRVHPQVPLNSSCAFAESTAASHPWELAVGTCCVARHNGPGLPAERSASPVLMSFLDLSAEAEAPLPCTCNIIAHTADPGV